MAPGLEASWIGSHLPKRFGGSREAPLYIWPVRPLLPRMVELAGNATAYDAAYLALAERLSISLLTGDAKLTGVPGVRCSFIAVS